MLGWKLSWMWDWDWDSGALFLETCGSRLRFVPHPSLLWFLRGRNCLGRLGSLEVKEGSEGKCLEYISLFVMVCWLT